MGRYMFDNKLFDTWLNARVENILPRMDEGNLTNEDMITLLLKAQTNHFHHMDDEFRGEFKAIRKEIENSDNEFKAIKKQAQMNSEFIQIQFNQVYKEIEQVDKRFEQVDKRFEQVDKRFEQIEKRFDGVNTNMKWQTGILLTFIFGIYLKLFFK